MNIAVIGAGSWGTAIAWLLGGKGYNVKIWAYEKEVSEGINRGHKNPLYLTQVLLPEKVKATSDIGSAVEGAEIVAIVVPSHTFREVVSRLSSNISEDIVIVTCTKGIETETGMLMSDILREVLPNVDEGRFTYLSGPSFAVEVAAGMPTSVVIAGKDPTSTRFVQQVFRTERFVTFTHRDVVGVELGGALKNVIAIAAGMSDGLGLGANARATIITRGLYEMMKVGEVFGAEPITFSGLSGMGDLVLTATSKTSRNYTLGFDLGCGGDADELIHRSRMVAEGVKTAKAVHEIKERHRLHLPICEEVYNVIYKRKDVEDAVRDLLKAGLSEEMHF